MNKYIGHQLQLYGIEKMQLVGGKGDGMQILNVRNGKGLEFSVSVDRCADISRISLDGVNLSYFAPCGYVSPKYYDGVGAGFLKSFTAGFFTTCGLTSVGSPCTDEGEQLPLHGTISNIPCENIGYSTEKDGLHIRAIIRDAAMFAHQLILEREYICSLEENVIYLKDTVKNIGSKPAPMQILYHCNMGYPLLTENSKVTVPAKKVIPRNEHAGNDIENCLVMEKPQADYEERCYYFDMKKNPTVSIYNEEISKGVNISYNTEEMKCFTLWKMMGEHEYVLGLEPGNCLPDGRDVMRKKNMLEFIAPGEERQFNIKFVFVTKK